MRDREPTFIPADIFDIETVRRHPPGPDEDPAKIAPPGAHRMVVAGMCRIRWDVERAAPRVVVASRYSHDEGRLVRHTIGAISDRATLVTFNGRRFDVPVILAACMRMGIEWPWFFCTPGVRVRWSTHGHIDLCDELSDHGAATMMGLDAWGAATGLGRKTDSGTSVADQWEQSPESVARYCAGDVKLTGLIYIRWLLVAGVIAPERADQFMVAIRDADVSIAEIGEQCADEAS